MRNPILIFLALSLIAGANADARDPDTVRLWPHGPPGSQSSPTSLTITERGAAGELRDRYATGITDPTLSVFAPREPNGQALLIVPGGGYVRVVMDKEGFETAEWFQQRGITAFVLLHRLPGESWIDGANVPLQDAQRALRWIRASSANYGVDKNRIGVLGFSAGGHVAASLATGFDRRVYAAVDAVDEVPARPDFAVLMYPVISMHADIAHAGSRERLLGPEPGAGMVRRYSVEYQVTPATPPVFLLHAADDDAVDVDNALRMFDSLRRHSVQVDLHVYAEGGHGFGMRYAQGLPIADWPSLLAAWLANR
jgi:acetyl esterase/lipase